MNKTKYNRLIINSGISDGEGHWMIFLFHASNLRTVAFNNEAYSYAQCYRLNEDGYMEIAENELWEDDFDELYYEADETDRAEDIKMFEALYYDEPRPFVKANWDNHNHYLQLSSEHGINTSKYSFEESVEILEGVCYDSEYCIEQDYPKTPFQNFFKFVTNDGKEYYIKETHPFFIDEHDYVYELITKEEFDEYDQA